MTDLISKQFPHVSATRLVGLVIFGWASAVDIFAFVTADAETTARGKPDMTMFFYMPPLISLLQDCRLHAAISSRD